MRHFSTEVEASVLAGALAGAGILGIGGRAAMRIIAILGGAAPSFSWDGTVEIIIFGAIVGGVIGFLYPFLLLKIPGQFFRGLLAGGLAFLIVFFLPMDAKNAIQGFTHILQKVLTIFGIVFALFGLGFASIQTKIANALESDHQD